MCSQRKTIMSALLHHQFWFQKQGTTFGLMQKLIVRCKCFLTMSEVTKRRRRSAHKKVNNKRATDIPVYLSKIAHDGKVQSKAMTRQMHYHSSLGKYTKNPT